MPIDLISNIAPKNNGSFPMMEDVHLLGGLQIRADITARDSIPALNRKVGMLVYVLSDTTLYELSGGVTNSDWVISNIGAGDGFVHTDSTGNTTTATPLNLFTLSSPPTDGLVLVKAFVLAGNDVDDRGVFERTARVNYDAGTPTLFDIQTDYTSKDEAAWDATIAIDGSNLVVRVTGDTSPITWTSTVSTKTVTTPAFVPPVPGINTSTFPTQIDVVLGSFWSFYGLSEDDVITLDRVSASTTEVVYTEDGTTTANQTTNRIRIRMIATTNSTGSNYWRLYAQGAGTSTYFTNFSSLPYTSAPSYSYLGSSPQATVDVAYTFLDLFGNNDQYGSGWPNVFKSMVSTP